MPSLTLRIISTRDIVFNLELLHDFRSLSGHRIWGLMIRLNGFWNAKNRPETR